MGNLSAKGIGQGRDDSGGGTTLRGKVGFHAIFLPVAL